MWLSLLSLPCVSCQLMSPPRLFHLVSLLVLSASRTSLNRPPTRKDTISHLLPAQSLIHFHHLRPTCAPHPLRRQSQLGSQLNKNPLQSPPRKRQQDRKGRMARNPRSRAQRLERRLDPQKRTNPQPPKLGKPRDRETSASNFTIRLLGG